ncbi:MAG: SH3 domain-containing protein [Anaerolineales bacterium]|nr:SH3 domain-containing protein [Anaerolineales bacterium]MCX7756563.1 SH3 domain-containing protein [Anaerolineales bacterium]MDW8278613.1 SH3 domain-containing protein [Anaerolineales bacterium]
MFKRPFGLLIVLAALLTACSKSASTPLPTITTSATEGATALVLPPTPLPSATPAGTPTPFSPFQVNPSVDGLKLRVGPGFLFDALRLLDKNSTLTVQGKAPGGEWIRVTAQDGAQGWVFAELLTSPVDLQAVPVIAPEGLVVIRGRVFDVLGSPIQGAGFEIRPEGAESGTTAVSDSNGEFFAFLPPGASGTWTVTHTSVACKGNVWADSGCSTYKPGYSGIIEPKTRTVTLPQTEPLEFIWR